MLKAGIPKISANPGIARIACSIPELPCAQSWNPAHCWNFTLYYHCSVIHSTMDAVNTIIIVLFKEDKMPNFFWASLSVCLSFVEETKISIHRPDCSGLRQCFAALAPPQKLECYLAWPRHANDLLYQPVQHILCSLIFFCIFLIHESSPVLSLTHQGRHIYDN